MAKMRIRWRNILRNLPTVTALCQALYFSWPELRDELQRIAKENERIAPVVQMGDALYRNLIRRR